MPEPDHITAEQMKMVLEVTRMLAVTTDLDKLLLRIAEATTSLLGCERASIFLHDKATDELVTRIALLSKEIRVPSHKGIVGATFQADKLLHVPDPYADPRFNPAPDKASGFRTRNILAVPMADLDGAPIGVMQAINKIGGTFTPRDEGMVEMLSDQAGVAIQRYRLQIAAEGSALMRREMELAKKIQEGLIPSCPPGIDGLQCAGWTKAASITGGDCYDLWRLPDGRLGIFLGDATGHGIGPALVVSQTRTLVRTLCQFETNPHRMFQHINARLSEDLGGERFCTAFLGFLSPEGLLHWTSAGHGPILIRQGLDGALESPETPAPPLGVDDSWPEHAIPDPVQLRSGGSLILMSDGIFEASNPEGEAYGIGRMIEMLHQSRELPPDQSIKTLRDSVNQWQVKVEPDDDQTIVIVQRTR